MLTGSFVSSYYGDPRTTRDLDLVVSATEPPDEAMRKFVDLCMAENFYVSERSALGHRVGSGARGPFQHDLLLQQDFLPQRARFAPPIPEQGP